MQMRGKDEGDKQVQLLLSLFVFPPNLSPACATLSFLNLHHDRRTLNEQAFREFPFIPHMNSKPWSVFFHLPEKKPKQPTRLNSGDTNQFSHEALSR